VTDPAQLDLFGNRPQLGASPNATSLQSLVPEKLSDEALIAALPDAVLADACALAAEVGKRRLTGIMQRFDTRSAQGADFA
jgi:ABC-type hemin transport system substrate-binding protein